MIVATKNVVNVFCILCLIAVGHAFAPNHAHLHRGITKIYMSEESKNGGVFSGITDFFGNMDAIAEDFFYKRMGKGEIFYGKRKFKPSGEVEGDYQGMGLSDKLKIDMAREYREEWLEEKRMRDEMRMLREEKEKRNAD
ncbi:hypothetical protein CTEN210_15087 [Chaetoceros tenuissimus]|uniref:Uncharacterized protein n=1 Tax=Chaetoceros tenuissimus TaxID=426638 RepID=A0AAD3D8G0_9STRA|nr:hypothetical protein CTEN210_15087 [Chaetoceros tenuissimus]